METRLEKDSLGEKEIQDNLYYGIHTARSIENFQISGIKNNSEFIKAIALLKIACAKANIGLGLLDKKKGSAIISASLEILNGNLNSQFPLDIFHAGSGTSLNMNVNEVIANKALELMQKKKGTKLIHPNDHVNMGQSTNDIIPSAIRISSLKLLKNLEKELKNLIDSLIKKSNEFKYIIKSGRTHLQDAVPITLGQEFHAYASALSKHLKRLIHCKEFLLYLGIGGNAVGTGLNTRPNFRKLVISHLCQSTKENFKVTLDGIESTQFLTDVLSLSSSLKLIAVDLNKIANDLRLLSSGPKTGFNEIILPAVEPGSSIMPGKTNPSILESLNMVCHKVIGNDTTITISCASGQLELNTHMPIIAHSIFESLAILTSSIKNFNHKCIIGILANKEKCSYYFENSMSIATALNPYLGYDKVAEIVKEAIKRNKTIKEMLIEKKIMKKMEIEKIFNPKSITIPNLTKTVSD